MLIGDAGVFKFAGGFVEQAGDVVNEGVVFVTRLSVVNGVLVEFQIGFATFDEGVFREAQIPVVQRAIVVDSDHFKAVAAVVAYGVVGQKCSGFSGNRAGIELIG